MRPGLAYVRPDATSSSWRHRSPSAVTTPFVGPSKGALAFHQATTEPASEYNRRRRDNRRKDLAQPVHTISNALEITFLGLQVAIGLSSPIHTRSRLNTMGWLRIRYIPCFIPPSPPHYFYSLRANSKGRRRCEA